MEEHKMAFNDFLKKAKESASTVAQSAKTAMNEQKEKMAANKAERELVKAQKQGEIDNIVAGLTEQINAASGNLFDMDSNTLLSFTE